MEFKEIKIKKQRWQQFKCKHLCFLFRKENDQENEIQVYIKKQGIKISYNHEL